MEWWGGLADASRREGGAGGTSSRVHTNGASTVHSWEQLTHQPPCNSHREEDKSQRRLRAGLREGEHRHESILTARPPSTPGSSSHISHPATLTHQPPCNSHREEDKSQRRLRAGLREGEHRHESILTARPPHSWEQLTHQPPCTVKRRLRAGLREGEHRHKSILTARPPSTPGSSSHISHPATVTEKRIRHGEGLELG
ncbi:hypothetical protein J6590_056700 [Homalodisca vitripennis]|nr:hypothetical protein J6590_056700 [Homalodisca vitripennis]